MEKKCLLQLMQMNEYTAYFDTECADALNLITGKKEDLSGKIVLPPYSFRFYRCM